MTNLDAESPSWCSPIEARLIQALATTSALALAYGKQAAAEQRLAASAKAVVAELNAVWDHLRGCAHAFDPECARCEWLAPLTEALASHNAPTSDPAEAAHIDGYPATRDDQ